MTSTQGQRRGWVRDLAPIVVTAVGLAVLTKLLGSELSGRGVSSWPLLLQLIGASTLVVGVLGLVRRPAEPCEGGVVMSMRPVALILAGAILVGGGWGAALGLALVTATGLVVERRRAGADDVDGDFDADGDAEYGDAEDDTPA